MDFVEKRKGLWAKSGAKRGLMIAGGFMTAGLSLFYYPVVFGAVGVVWGILVSKNDFRKGRGLILSSLIFMGLGLFAKEFWSI